MCFLRKHGLFFLLAVLSSIDSRNMPITVHKVGLAGVPADAKINTAIDFLTFLRNNAENNRLLACLHVGIYTHGLMRDLTQLLNRMRK